VAGIVGLLGVALSPRLRVTPSPVVDVQPPLR